MSSKKSYDWHRQYHSRALTSYASLSAEQRGVAYTLLDLMYDRQGPLIESDRILAARMNMGKNKFGRIRDELIAAGKFHFTEDGYLWNRKVEKELGAVAKISEIRAKSARKPSENFQNGPKKPRKNNASNEAKSEQNGNRDKDRESNSPLSGGVTPLPPDGALALEALRAAVGQGGQSINLHKLEACITGWDDGTFFVGRWAADTFSTSLRGPLAEAGVRLAAAPPTTPKADHPALRVVSGGADR